MSGRVLGVSTAKDCSKSVNFNYIATLQTQKFWVVPEGSKWLLTHITGIPRVAGSDGSAVSLSFYKAASGIAVASGTILHSGVYDMKGTADTNQNLVLVTDQTVLTFVAGDAIGFALTGTATAAIGAICATFEPFNS